MLSWLTEVLVVIPFLSEQSDDWSERAAILGKVLNDREWDLCRHSPRKTGNSRKSDAPGIEFCACEQDRNRDFRFPVDTLGVETCASINSDYATSARWSVERLTFRRFATYLAGFASVAQPCAQSRRGRPARRYLPYLNLLLFYPWPSFPPFPACAPLPRDRC